MSPQCFLPSFKSKGLSVQEEKWKIDLQDGRNDGELGFPIRTILAMFDSQVTPMLPSQSVQRFRSCLKCKELTDRRTYDGQHAIAWPETSLQVS